ncbi:S16 family serine protease [Gaiella sp.]|uniref:S16 family serine protease n=1 Tax=Gaiella sp. TaxID=2663207 RepID=UPI003266D9F2
MTRNRLSWLLWGIVTVAAAAIAFAWFAPSRSYLYVPNEATPVGDKVTVEGERPGGDDVGAIYYVDVNVRSATWAESLLPFVRPDGASLVPRDQVVPPGSSFEDRRAEGFREMARSEQTAAAVALRQAGYTVKATPRGALVDAVASDAPAAKVLRSGDVITGVGDTDVLTPIALRQSFTDVRPGDDVVLRLRRKGTVKKVTVRTIESPREPGKAIIGIRVSQDADIKLPLKVEIDLGAVGGPSAGLPFALDVLQELGTDVDHGKRVVATGEIGLDGSVGPIGGVKQKTYGARKAGADVFLVPAGENAAEARRYAGNLRIIPVTSFQQALSALAKTPTN